MMHVHRGRVSLSRTLRFLSASERFSQSRGIGKAAGIDAGHEHGPAMSRAGRPEHEGSWQSVSPSQVRATLEYLAAAGDPAGRTARAMPRARDRIRFKSAY